MTVRPIIFAAPMVRALLDGRKTQTRRLITTPLVRVKVGDRLYVREAFQLLSFGDYKPTTYWPADPRYFADDPCAGLDADARGYSWRPSIHMPRYASRLWLEVTEVREQRLQDITEADVLAEGCEVPPPRQMQLFGMNNAERREYRKRLAHFEWAALWNSLHTKEGERWEDNPWIVALTFTVHHGNIDAAPAAQEAA